MTSVELTALPAFRPSRKPEKGLVFKRAKESRLKPIGTERLQRLAPLAWVLLIALTPMFALAAPHPGNLDDTFGGDGRIVTPFDGDIEFAIASDIQSDGKIVVAGRVDAAVDKVAVARYKRNGRLDQSFGGDGTATMALDGGPFPQDVLVTKKGKVLVAGIVSPSGDSDFFLVRFKSNGHSDGSFGTNGKVFTDFSPDDRARKVFMRKGKIYAVGSVDGDETYYDGAIARYHRNGKLDTNSDSDPGSHFSSDGIAIVDFEDNDDGLLALRFLRRGKIMTAGYSRAGDHVSLILTRLRKNGKKDRSFGVMGTKRCPFEDEAIQLADIAVTPKGFIAGASVGSPPNGSQLLRRYRKKGQVDESFHNDGIVVIDDGDQELLHAIAVQQNGKVLTTGYTDNGTRQRILLVRLTKNGFLNDSFGSDGFVKTSFPGDQADSDLAGRDLSIQENGKIVVPGAAGVGESQADWLVARYIGDEN